MTLWEFCQCVAEAKGTGKALFESVGSEMFRTLAPRPIDTTYDLTKLRSEGIEPMGVMEGLGAMLEDDDAL